MNIWNLTKKDMRVIFKDRAAVVWIFILPIVFLLIFAFLGSRALGGSSGDEEADNRTPLVVVNLDAGGEQAKLFIENLDHAGGYRAEISELEAAQARLNTLKISRYLVIPAGFSADLALGKPVEILLITHPGANSQGSASVLQVVTGVAQDISLELQLLDGIRRMGDLQAGNPQVLQAFQPDKVLAQASSQFERSRTTPLVAVIQQEPQIETAAEQDEFDFNQSFVPGVCVLFVFLSATSVAHGIYEERKFGSLRRLLAAPLTRVELMTGKLLPIWLLTMVQIVVIFAFGALIMPLLGLGKLGVGEDPLAWAVASIVIALCSTCLGIFIAALARTEGQISGLSNALLWVAGFLGGAILPAFLMQQIPVLNFLSHLVPQFYATQAYYDILARGKSLAEVLPALGVLLVFSAVFFFIGIRRFRFE